MSAPTARAAKRDLVAGILAAQLPALGGRVFRARVWPIKPPEMPCALVYGWQETKTRKTADAWTHQFEVSCVIAVQGMVQAATGPDAEIALENLAGDIEAAVLTAPELLGLTGSIERIDRVDTKLEASRPSDAPEMVLGTVSMGFELVWTEIQQVTVPAGEVTDDFGIKSFPTIY